MHRWCCGERASVCPGDGDQHLGRQIGDRTVEHSEIAGSMLCPNPLHRRPGVCAAQVQSQRLVSENRGDLNPSAAKSNWLLPEFIVGHQFSFCEAPKVDCSSAEEPATDVADSITYTTTSRDSHQPGASELVHLGVVREEPRNRRGHAISTSGERVSIQAGEVAE